MDFGGIVLAGIVGAAAMTALMYLAPFMGIPPIDMPLLLGTMFIERRPTALVLGFVIHFMMGIVFALLYAWLWSLGVGAATLLWGLVFGLVHGVVTAMMMPLMMTMHPHPPELTVNAMAVLGIVLVHHAFGMVVALVYSPPQI